MRAIDDMFRVLCVSPHFRLVSRRDPLGTHKRGRRVRAVAERLAQGSVIASEMFAVIVVAIKGDHAHAVAAVSETFET